MTVKEIINGLKFTVDMFLTDPFTGETYKEPRNDMDKTTVDACKGAAELLSELAPKTGQWISVSYNAGPHVWKCDKCGNLQRINTNFCCDCGAKMVTELASKTGQWIIGNNHGLGVKTLACSECGYVEVSSNIPNFCSNCGAKMLAESEGVE